MAARSRDLVVPLKDAVRHVIITPIGLKDGVRRKIEAPQDFHPVLRQDRSLSQILAERVSRD